MATTIVILLPGTTGSSLGDSSGNVVWPTLVNEALDDNQVTQALALLETPALVPMQPSGWGDPAGIYGSMQAFFAQRGFDTAVVTSAASLPASLAARQLLGFAYDWRVDNRTTAAVFASILDRIGTLAAGAPYEVWLIAHSMGGLVARSVLEPLAAGGSPLPPWFANVKALITLGTPHLGAPLALQAVLGQLPFFVPAAEVAFVTKFLNANEEDYDSSYELLPPPDQSFISVGGGPAVSVFDLGSDAQSSLLRHGASATFLNQAQSYFGTLQYDVLPSLPPYYCVYGVTLLGTTTGYAYHPLFDSWAPNSTLGGGDDIVPAKSARFAGRAVAGTHQVFANHIVLPQNAQAQAYIGSLMNLPS